MMRSSSRSELFRGVAAAGAIALAASVCAAIAAAAGYHAAEYGALALAVAAGAVLLAKLRQSELIQRENNASRADMIGKIAAVCDAVAGGNFEARIAPVDAAGIGELQSKVNAMLERCTASTRAAAAGVDGVIAKIATVCHEVRKGNFEARIIGINETGSLADVQNKVNDMIDCCDAFVREATASLDAVCRNIYYRRILPGGLQGSFRVAAGMINGSIETQKLAVEKARAEAAAQQARIIDSLARGLKNLAEGNLAFRITDLPEAYAQVRDDFNGAIGRLQETIQAIAAATREVASATAEISTSTTDLSQRTEQQAASLEQTSAAMEQILATVRNNAENARQASDSAGNTRGIADRGGQVVAEAVDAMGRIEESSSKVSDIIGVIDEIARQTNLLALNAAVEAARAGDAGRGFAVVASEVRSLAQRSSEAAKNVKDLINASDAQVKDGVGLVKRAGSSLGEIVASIKGVADAVRDIASASGQQATGIEEVNKALTQMDQVTQQNSALVEENAATAKTLEDQAKVMDERVAFFRVDKSEPHVSAAASRGPAHSGAARIAAN